MRGTKDNILKAFPIKNIGLQLVMFLYFYNIPLQLFKIPFSSGKLISIISISYILIRIIVQNGKIYKLSREYFFLFSGVFIIYIITFILLKIVYNTPNNYYLNTLNFYIIEYFFGALFIIEYYKIYDLLHLVKNIIFLAVLQAMIMVGSLFIVPLKNIVVKVMEANPDFLQFSNAEYIKDSFRGLTLASDRTLGMSIFFSLSIMLIYVYISTKNSRISYFKYTLYFVVIFCGGILAARTFFVGLFFGLILILLLYRNKIIYVLRLKRFIMIISLVCVCVVLSTPWIVTTFFLNSKDEIDFAFNWIFEVFINSEAKGFEKSESLYDLVYNNLTVLPKNLQTFLIGDPNRKFENGIHYMGVFTDSGYLRMLFVYGIIGSLTIYIFWVIIFMKTSKLFSKSEGIRYFLLMMSIVMFIGQVKFDVFPGNALNLKLLIIFFVLGVERKKMLSLNILKTNER